MKKIPFVFGKVRSFDRKSVTVIGEDGPVMLSLSDDACFPILEAAKSAPFYFGYDPTDKTLLVAMEGGAVFAC